MAVLLLLTVGYYIEKRKPEAVKRTQHKLQSINKPEGDTSLNNYDIIFQMSQSEQSEAIQLATHSPYSHCGLIHWEAGNCSVWEAHNGVTAVSIEEFISRGKGGHYVIKRLKNAEDVFNPPPVGAKMEELFYQYLNRPYDFYFGWGDDKLYCSELVWKLYKQAAGVELGRLHPLKDLDLGNPMVKLKMKQRYGSNIPMNENVISPADIFNSDLLVTVVRQ
jgi:hypothetical protein